MSSKYSPFSPLAKKDTKFYWHEHYHCAFEDINLYLFNPLVLAAIFQGKPLISFITALYTSVLALFAQCNDDKNNVHYIIKFIFLFLLGLVILFWKGIL